MPFSRQARSPEAASRTFYRERPVSRLRQVSGLIGAILLGLAVFWFVWLLFHHYVGGGSSLSGLPLPGLAPTYPPVEQIPALAAAGITLANPTQAPTLNQQQALLLASQLQPGAATKAHKTLAQYVLLNYNSTSTTAPHRSLSKIPAWMVVYQRIPLEPADASVDPTPFPQSYQDLYVFLDATSGKELLSVWV